MKKPVLFIKCKECGAIYAGCSLSHGVSEEFSQSIIDAVKAGDELFVDAAGNHPLNMCKCDNANGEAKSGEIEDAFRTVNCPFAYCPHTFMYCQSGQCPSSNATPEAVRGE